MALILFLIFSVFPVNVEADYECLCSYKIEMPVNIAANRDSRVLGYMYEFDCKPTVKVAGGPKQNWQTIAYEHQVGYVFVDSQISTQICPGNPSIEDPLTTHTYPPTTPTRPPTSAAPTTTSAPTSTKQRTPMELFTTSTPHTTTSTTASTSTKQTTPMELFTTSTPQTTTSTTASTSTKQTTPMELFTTSTPQTTTSTTASTSTKQTTPMELFTTSTPQTTTSTTASTSTKQTTPMEHFTTSTPQTTTSTTSSTSTTTTTLPTTTTKTTSTTEPTTTKTTTVTTTVKLTTAPPTPPVMLGDVRSCPHTLHQYTIEDKGALGKFGDSCYEIVPIRTTWLKAENDCTAKGGHLFHISNQREQEFILLFINSNQFALACWMGLNDIISEETFDWISGDRLTYTNWWHDRKGNFFSHHTEDCVLFVPYSPYFGKWDDVPCGSTNIFGTEQGQRNPFICQFSFDEVQFNCN